VYAGKNPIQAQQRYITAVRNRKYPLFETILRENRTFFSNVTAAPLPVILRKGVGSAQQKVLNEIEDLVSEVLGRMEA